jgi:hypothetical protein
VLIPLLLIVFAALAAAVVAYGPHPAWGQFEHGLQLIVWSRRLQWPLVALSIMLCLLLIAMVVLGKRRAWWLVGLGPILALFVHHFALFSPDRAGALAVLENPPMVDAASAGGLSDDDWVVGVTFAGGEYAYPYAALFRDPVIIQTDRDSRMVLLWSAYANRVLAFRVSDAVKARNLEVVSTPANAPLIYDTRHGQFINGLKGLTLDGRTPPGFSLPLRTTKTTWKQWRSMHPDGRVMALPATGADAAPTRPILPAWRIPGSPPSVPTDFARRVTVVGVRKPVVMEASDVTAAPANLLADGQQVLLFRPAPDAAPRAFDARLPAEPHLARAGDASSTLAAPDTSSSWFVRLSGRRLLAAHPDAAFIEVNSKTLWTADGSGAARTKFAGKRLQPVPVDDDVDWDVMKYWYPDLKLTVPDQSATQEPATVRQSSP